MFVVVIIKVRKGEIENVVVIVSFIWNVVGNLFIVNYCKEVCRKIDSND